MRKIIVFNNVSVDGFFAGVDGNLNWLTADDESDKFAVEQTRDSRLLLFGRTTYQMFESFWPAVLKDHKTSENTQELARNIDDAEKIVFSRTLKKVTWNNSRLVKEINPEEIRKMKQEPGKDMVILGSGTIVQMMTNLSLIDEYQLMVNPVILGKGKPLFKDMKDTVNLRLLTTRTFNNGKVLLSYQKK
jgi:dihydrofolate reductase